jgi:hypothetical protein
VGTNLVTWTATDSSGNTATCQQRVVVRDNQPPTITCPADVTVSANAGVCYATGVVLGSATASENCGAVTVTSNAPPQFPVGTNLVTWTATDSSGNTATCQQRVIVRDILGPVITCPPNLVVHVAPGQSVSNVVFNVTASDLCGSVTNLISVPASGSAFPLGVTTVTSTATDNSGNSSQCAFTVTVTNHPPVAHDDSYVLSLNSALIVAAAGVLANDTDPDADPLTAVLVTGPLHGTLNLLANGGFTYTPASNYFGVDTFTYHASDGLTNSGPATVSLVVSTGPEFGILQGTNVFNPQTGLFEQNVTVTNIGGSTAAAVRLLVGGLRTNVYLYNASGTNAGTPFVQYNSPLNPGFAVQLVLEFYDGDRRPFTNTLEAQAVLPGSTGTNAAAGVPIDRVFVDSRIAGDPRFVIEFTTIPGRTYTIIYSDDNFATWQAATPSLTANATRTQWYDDGPPKTESKPFSNASRMYRVIVAPVQP